MSETVENVVIVGTGCAGLTAAIYTARANLNPIVLEGTQPGGQLTTTSEVENFPGFPHGVDGFELMDNLRKQATRFGTRFQHATVASIDVSGPVRVIKTGEGEIRTRALIIATGASARYLGLPSEQLAIALIGFNVGVELGQLAIVAAFVPLAWALRRTGFYRWGILVVGSIGIAAVGLTWFIERVMGALA